MKDLSVAKQIIGMRISRDMKTYTLKLSQENYIKKVLNRFNMQKPINTLLASHFKLPKEDSPKTKWENGYMSKVPYAFAIDNFMYALVSIRPSIAQVVEVVSRYFSTLEKKH